MGAKSVTLARQKRKRELVEIMGGKCVLCGYDKCIAALEFHHLDKSKKEYQISSGNCHGWEEDIKELRKCALVCSNCHKEIEAFGLIVCSTFNEEKFQELDKQKQYQKEHNCCKKCGKEITRRSSYCSDCWYLLSQKTERPSREQLKELIRNNTFTSIGDMFNISDNSVRKWCKKYNLPSSVKDIQKYTDKEWEKI